MAEPLLALADVRAGRTPRGNEDAPSVPSPAEVTPVRPAVPRLDDRVNASLTIPLTINVSVSVDRGALAARSAIRPSAPGR